MRPSHLNDSTGDAAGEAAGLDRPFSYSPGDPEVPPGLEESWPPAEGAGVAVGALPAC
jgi:hypothetical protein